MFQLDHAVTYTPTGENYTAALKKTTHLGIGAHQDDLEIMAIEGILACYDDPDKHFSGVIVNDGAGAPRSGPYAGFTNEQMAAARGYAEASPYPDPAAAAADVFAEGGTSHA